MSDKIEDEKLAIVRRIGKRVQQEIEAMPKVELLLQGLSIFVHDLSKGSEILESENENPK